MTRFADLRTLRSEIENPQSGLPEDVFLFISSLTPLVNVDLLIQDSQKGHLRTLLTWRDDEFYHGWHLPGGIVRFKECFAERIHFVATRELRSDVETISPIVEVNEKIHSTRDFRGHFISILFKVTLKNEPPLGFQCQSLEQPLHGQWLWHEKVPHNLLSQHDVYRKYMVETED